MGKVISLFSGAGGLDLGIEAAGLEVGVGVELDPEAVVTLRANRAWPVIDRDIHQITTQEMLDASNLRPGEADLLIGGPPCQPFSKSGYWAKGDALRLSDPRATTLEAYLRVLHEAQPRAFLLENVAGLAYKNKDEGLRFLEDTLADINRRAGTQYSLSMALLNAADYGVPQERERVFLIGHREGRRFKFPEPTHARAARGGGHEPTPSHLLTPPPRLDGLLPPTTAWDALGDLENDRAPELQMRGKWAGLLASIPEGCNYLYHTERGGGQPLFGWRRRFWNFLLKLSKHAPSWTLTAQPGPAVGPFHWNNRRLSARELCRLQTFPDGYKIIGDVSSAQRQLGNAVPSALAEVLGREIRRQLLDQTPAQGPLTLLPPTRRPIPAPNPVAPIPAEYLALVGEHEAHPGTGLGYGALARAALEEAS
jgi:DNA (cytosine-5)-methyltransferase 1